MPGQLSGSLLNDLSKYFLLWCPDEENPKAGRIQEVQSLIVLQDSRCLTLSTPCLYLETCHKHQLDENQSIFFPHSFSDSVSETLTSFLAIETQNSNCW